MKLYDYKPAPNPRRVRMFLAEKGVNIETEQVVLFKGEHRSAAFLAKNPFGRVPVLELDNGTCLAESMAICRYIEELNPSPPLFGTNVEERAVVEMMQRAAEFELLFPIANAFRHGTETAKALEPNQIAAWADLSRARALNGMRVFDELLAGREFAAGKAFTVADITALCAIDFGANARAVKMPDDLKHLKRWYEAMLARPSAAA